MSLPLNLNTRGESIHFIVLSDIIKNAINKLRDENIEGLGNFTVQLDDKEGIGNIYANENI